MNDSSMTTGHIADNLAAVRERIAAAAAACGRDPAGVTLVAVGKTHPAEAIAAALAAGQTVFGENRVQEAQGKFPALRAAHPELVRLLLWEGLSGGPLADEANRTAHYRHKAQAYAAAQRAGVLDGDLDPEYLVFLIIALAAWWIGRASCRERV